MLDLIDRNFVNNLPLNEYIKLTFDGKVYIFRLEDVCAPKSYAVKYRWYLWIETVNSKELEVYTSPEGYSSLQRCKYFFYDHLKELGS